jgi:hypothetical protein
MAWCSGKSAGASHQKAHDADAAVSAVRDSNDRWKARYLARDSARDDSLAHFQQIVTRLRGRVVPRDTVVRLVPDSARPFVETQLAVRDSVIAQQDSQLTLYRAMIVDRDSLLVRKDRQIAALETARDAWRKAASPNVFQKVGRAVPWIAAGVIVGRLLK